MKSAAHFRLLKHYVALTIAASCALSALAQDTNALAPVITPYSEIVSNLPGKGPAQKGAWFDKIWKERRANFASHRETDRGAVVFFGDSITQGLGTPIRLFPGLKTANRGIGGDTTRGLLYRMQEDVLDLHPVAIVLLIGTNDLDIGADPEDAAANIRDILAAIKKSNSKTPVIVCQVMPSSATKHRPADKIKKLNALVDEAISGDPQFIRCDTWSIYADENGDAKKEEFPDLLHPNTAGYAKWKAALDPIFAKLNFIPAESKPAN